MNSVLEGVLANNTPRVNRKVVDGVSGDILETLPEYLSKIYQGSIKSLTSKAGLTYEGYRILTPKEEFNTLFTNDITRSSIDLARSDMYVVEFVFKFQNQIIKRNLYLPFAGEANIMYASNTPYSIIPVLSDTVISPSAKEVFVRLLKDKLTFKSTTKGFMLNGEKFYNNLIHTNIIKTKNMTLEDKVGKPLTSVSIYLLAKYGFKESMNKYLHIPETDYKLVIETDFNKLKELESEYNVFGSTGLKPKYLKVPIYTPHNLYICISKKHKITPLMENFIFGMLYTLELFTETASEIKDQIEHNDLETEIYSWRIILGKITYKGSFGIGRIYEDVYEHFETLEGYLDELIKIKLEDNGVKLETFYDLLAYIMANYNEWLLNSKNYNADINNRYIDILYYIAYGMIIGFNKVILAINKRVIRKSATLSIKEINKVFSNDLQPRKAFNIVKNGSKSLAIIMAETSNDSKYMNITSNLEDQNWSLAS